MDADEYILGKIAKILDVDLIDGNLVTTKDSLTRAGDRVNFLICIGHSEGAATRLDPLGLVSDFTLGRSTCSLVRIRFPGSTPLAEHLSGASSIFLYPVGSPTFCIAIKIQDPAVVQETAMEDGQLIQETATLRISLE